MATASSVTRAQHSEPGRSSFFEVTQEMVNAVHAPSQEDFHTKTAEFPGTIGRHRLPIEALQGEFKWNESMVKQIQLLGEKYSSWRRSRGNGNSLYRCVGVLLCEHYCRPNTPMQELGAMYRMMVDQISPFLVETDDVEDMGNIKMWLRLVKDLFVARAQGENAFQRLQYLLRSQQIDRAIVIAMRNYSACYCRLHANDPEFSAFLTEGPDSLVRDILEYGKEAEGLTLLFLSRVFDVVLHIVDIDGKSKELSETIYRPSARGWYPSMHLLHLPGQYRILFPTAWDAADGYDFATNKYTPVCDGRIISYEESIPQSDQ